MMGMRMGMGLGAPMQAVSGESLPTEGGIEYGGYIYHIFEADGELEVLANVDVEYLIVGAGGKGADGNNTGSGYGGGGGGAGGLLVGSRNLAQSIDPYFITIGALGSDTSAFSLTAKGGGDGGGYMANGNPGGSGGGAGGKAANTTLTGGSPTVGQGNAGGANNDGLSFIAGGAGGGGYGSIGSIPIDFAGANGGNGFNLNTVWGLVNGIIGAQTVGVNGLFAGGGGGGARTTYAVGAGGSGGGGAGGQQAGAISPTPGVANTGGGGGGGGGNGSNTLGAIGGSGIVIVRYAI
jgi:hypothetical protein